MVKEVSYTNLVIIVLLSIGIWLGADFYGEYKKSNLTEQDKIELMLKTEAENKEITTLLKTDFSDVRTEDKARWVMESVKNSLVARFVIAFAAIAGFGAFYLMRFEK